MKHRLADAARHPRRLAFVAALAAIGGGGGALAEEGRSAYTTLDLSACDALERAEIGAVFQCEGHEGWPLFVSTGDLRYDVDVGRRNDAFFTINAFNELGETVEWRYGPGDRGLRAIIVRYYYFDERPEPYASDLAVIAAPTERRGSCYLAMIPADASPSQNEVARRVADLADVLQCIEHP